MQKIIFNEALGLHEAVMDGRKTQTRRRKPVYVVGEVVAIAQRYEDILSEYPDRYTEEQKSIMRSHMGYWNKMNVKASVMPHHIRITGMRTELLQDITTEDCMREGIYMWDPGPEYDPIQRHHFTGYSYNCLKARNIKKWWYNTPELAFQALINKLYKGMWEENPEVYVYDFELID